MFSFLKPKPPLQRISENIRNGLYRTSDEVREVIDALQSIGTNEAAQEIHLLFLGMIPSEREDFIFDDGLVLHAINALKAMRLELSGLWISNLIMHECLGHQNGREVERLNGLPPLELVSHEDAAIAAILEMEDRMAIPALSQIKTYYPEKVLAALKTVDSQDIVPAILHNPAAPLMRKISSSDTHNVHALLDVSDQVRSGAFKSISPESLQEAVWGLSKKLTNVKRLLELFDRSTELSGEVKEALKRVDESRLLFGEPKLMPLFHAVSAFHQRTSSGEATLEKRHAALSSSPLSPFEPV